MGLGSSGLTGTCVRGLELIRFAASMTRDHNVSTLGAISFNVTAKTRFMLCTNLSQAPPASGFPGQLNRHSIDFVDNSLWIALLSMKLSVRRISLLAPTKLVPWSLRMRAGTPRRLQMFFMQSKHASVEKSVAISICTARTVKQVNRAIHLFSWRLPTVTFTGLK